MNLSDRVKHEVSLRDLAERRGVIFDAKKSQPRHGDYWAPCPFHAEVTPSFHIVEPQGSGGFFKCFGCGVSGTVVDYVMALDGLTAAEALKRLAEDHGLDRDLDPVELARRQKEIAAKKAKAEKRAAREAESRWKGAVIVWKKARAPLKLLGEYLTSRGVDLSALGGVPPTLRLADPLNFWADGQNRRKDPPAHLGPAMVGAIGRGQLVGVHRTWITTQGRARLPDGEKVAKKWLGRTGAMHGQPVKLSPTRPTMVVGEGIETTLAAFSFLIRKGARGISAEAALSRGALSDGSWQPPHGVERVILLGEGSSKKPAAAKAAFTAARDHIRAAGVDVTVRLPRDRWDLDLDAADIAKELTG